MTIQSEIALSSILNQSLSTGSKSFSIQEVLHNVLSGLEGTCAVQNVHLIGSRVTAAVYAHLEGKKTPADLLVTYRDIDLKITVIIGNTDNGPQIERIHTLVQEALATYAPEEPKKSAPSSQAVTQLLYEVGPRDCPLQLSLYMHKGHYRESKPPVLNVESFFFNVLEKTLLIQRSGYPLWQTHPGYIANLLNRMRQDLADFERDASEETEWELSSEDQEQITTLRQKIDESEPSAIFCEQIGKEVKQFLERAYVPLMLHQLQEGRLHSFHPEEAKKGIYRYLEKLVSGYFSSKPLLDRFWEGDAKGAEALHKECEEFFLSTKHVPKRWLIAIYLQFLLIRTQGPAMVTWQQTVFVRVHNLLEEEKLSLSHFIDTTHHSLNVWALILSAESWSMYPLAGESALRLVLSFEGATRFVLYIPVSKLPSFFPLPTEEQFFHLIHLSRAEYTRQDFEYPHAPLPYEEKALLKNFEGPGAPIYAYLWNIKRGSGNSVAHRTAFLEASSHYRHFARLPDIACRDLRDNLSSATLNPATALALLQSLKEVEETKIGEYSEEIFSLITFLCKEWKHSLSSQELVEVLSFFLQKMSEHLLAHNKFKEALSFCAQLANSSWKVIHVPLLHRIFLDEKVNHKESLKEAVRKTASALASFQQLFTEKLTPLYLTWTSDLRDYAKIISWYEAGKLPSFFYPSLEKAVKEALTASAPADLFQKWMDIGYKHLKKDDLYQTIKDKAIASPEVLKKVILFYKERPLDSPLWTLLLPHLSDKECVETLSSLPLITAAGTDYPLWQALILKLSSLPRKEEWIDSLMHKGWKEEELPLLHAFLISHPIEKFPEALQLKIGALLTQLIQAYPSFYAKGSEPFLKLLKKAIGAPSVYEKWLPLLRRWPLDTSFWGAFLSTLSKEQLKNTIQNISLWEQSPALSILVTRALADRDPSLLLPYLLQKEEEPALLFSILDQNPLFAEYHENLWAAMSLCFIRLWKKHPDLYRPLLEKHIRLFVEALSPTLKLSSMQEAIVLPLLKPFVQLSEITVWKEMVDRLQLSHTLVPIEATLWQQVAIDPGPLLQKLMHAPAIVEVLPPPHPVRIALLTTLLEQHDKFPAHASLATVLAVHLENKKGTSLPKEAVERFCHAAFAYLSAMKVKSPSLQMGILQLVALIGNREFAKRAFCLLISELGDEPTLDPEKLFAAMLPCYRSFFEKAKTKESLADLVEVRKIVTSLQSPLDEAMIAANGDTLELLASCTDLALKENPAAYPSFHILYMQALKAHPRDISKALDRSLGWLKHSYVPGLFGLYANLPFKLLEPHVPKIIECLNEYGRAVALESVSLRRLSFMENCADWLSFFKTTAPCLDSATTMNYLQMLGMLLTSLPPEENDKWNVLTKDLLDALQAHTSGTGAVTLAQALIPLAASELFTEGRARFLTSLVKSFFANKRSSHNLLLLGAQDIGAIIGLLVKSGTLLGEEAFTPLRWILKEIVFLYSTSSKDIVSDAPYGILCIAKHLFPSGHLDEESIAHLYTIALLGLRTRPARLNNVINVNSLNLEPSPGNPKIITISSLLAKEADLQLTNMIPILEKLTPGILDPITHRDGQIGLLTEKALMLIACFQSYLLIKKHCETAEMPRIHRDMPHLLNSVHIEIENHIRKVHDKLFKLPPEEDPLKMSEALKKEMLKTQGTEKTTLRIA